MAKHERIRKFVQDRAPQYRPLLKHKTAAVELIPPNVSDERLDIELYKIEQSYDAELRQRYHTILASNGDGTVGSNGAGAQEKGVKEHADFERELERFLEEWNEAGVSKLARHVLHRKSARIGAARWRCVRSGVPYRPALVAWFPATDQHNARQR